MKMQLGRCGTLLGDCQECLMLMEKECAIGRCCIPPVRDCWDSIEARREILRDVMNYVSDGTIHPVAETAV